MGTYFRVTVCDLFFKTYTYYSPRRRLMRPDNNEDLLGGFSACTYHEWQKAALEFLTSLIPEEAVLLE